MTSKSPSYTTQNNFGIYIFQFRFPKHLKSKHPEIQTLFRRSLYTRCKREANSKARLWWLLMDELTRRMLVEPSIYGRAMELLMKWQDNESLNWEKLRDFYESLEEYDQELLDRAIKHKQKLIESIGISPSNDAQPSSTYLPYPQNSQLDIQINPNTFTDSKINANDVELSELLERFLEFKKTTMSLGSIMNYEPRVKIFVKILMEYRDGKSLRISDLSPELVRHYKDTLRLLPASRAKFKAGTTIKRMIAEKSEPISQKTYKDTSNFIGQFFNWAEDEGYSIQKDLTKIFNTIKKPTKSQTKQRDRFTIDELKRLFESEEYKNGVFSRSSEYWIPLIALFTGARMGEIIQLNVTDVRKEDDIWVFDINDENDKSVKTECGKRLVPIHSKLINIGFLDFVIKRKKSSDRLFPEELRAVNGKFSNFSKRFSTYRNKKGVITPDNKRLDFHSFRHTVRTALVDASVNETLIDDIIGHSSKESIGKKIYTHTQQLPQKKKAIEKLQYAIDFSKLKRWDSSRFYRQLRNP